MGQIAGALSTLGGKETPQQGVDLGKKLDVLTSTLADSQQAQRTQNEQMTNVMLALLNHMKKDQ